jgi:hypothetical protein
VTLAAPLHPEVDRRFAAPGTLLFGIGAQKAGTTWLCAFMAAHPSIHMARGKELHYWNSVRPPHDAFPRQEGVRALQAARAAGQAQAVAYAELRLAMHGDGAPPHARYADALFAGYAGQPVVCDFTPAYARLTTPTFREMAALAADVRFVFLMRDPVDRLLSGLRMQLRWLRGGAEPDGAALAAAVGAALDNPADPHVARSRYDVTLRQVQAAVPERRLFCGFFETLFDQAETDRLCSFLGVGPRRADVAARVHAGGAAADLPPGVLARAASVLAPAYAFVRGNFRNVPAAWRAAGA